MQAAIYSLPKSMKTNMFKYEYLKEKNRHYIAKHRQEYKTISRFYSFSPTITVWTLSINQLLAH